MAHELLHLSHNMITGLTTSQKRRLEYLFSIGVLFVWIDGEIGVKGLLRGFRVSEGDLEVYLNLAIVEIGGVGA